MEKQRGFMKMSAFTDGHLTNADAYGKPDEEDKLLSAFQVTDNSEL